jgi:hypothetical protein
MVSLFLEARKQWSRYACQLKSDLEILQKECDEKSVAQSELLAYCWNLTTQLKKLKMQT